MSCSSRSRSGSIKRVDDRAVVDAHLAELAAESKAEVKAKRVAIDWDALVRSNVRLHRRDAEASSSSDSDAENGGGTCAVVASRPLLMPPLVYLHASLPASHIHPISILPHVLYPLLCARVTCTQTPALASYIPASSSPLLGLDLGRPCCVSPPSITQ